MYLKRIDEDSNIFYLTTNENKGLGNILINDTLTNILQFVQNDLFNENTDYQNDRVFADLGSEGVVTEVGYWYAIQLENDLYQIILTEDAILYNLPKRPTWTGSITDLIGYLYNILA
jgi:hypothetical protein